MIDLNTLQIIKNMLDVTFGQALRTLQVPVITNPAALPPQVSVVTNSTTFYLIVSRGKWLNINIYKAKDFIIHYFYLIYNLCTLFFLCCIQRKKLKNFIILLFTKSN